MHNSAEWFLAMTLNVTVRRSVRDHGVVYACTPIRPFYLLNEIDWRKRNFWHLHLKNLVFANLRPTAISDQKLKWKWQYKIINIWEKYKSLNTTGVGWWQVLGHNSSSSARQSVAAWKNSIDWWLIFYDWLLSNRLIPTLMIDLDQWFKELRS